MDGAANQKGSGIGIVLVSPECVTMEKLLRLGFSSMNNKVEYEALREGLSTVKKLLWRFSLTRGLSWGK